MNQMFEQQLTSIKILLLEISNDRKWINLRRELLKYEIYLKQQLALANNQNNNNYNNNYNNNNNNITNGVRPTKPPLRLKSNSVPNERGKGDDENENENENDNDNKNRIFPTKPPMRLKQQSQLNKNNPLLRLFIRLPTNNMNDMNNINNNNNNRNEKFAIQTIEIVIWHGDDNEIQQVVNKLCYTNQLQQYKNDIKNTILDLIK